MNSKLSKCLFLKWKFWRTKKIQQECQENLEKRPNEKEEEDEELLSVNVKK